MRPDEAAKFRRRVLEELPERSASSPAKPFLNYRYLPGANLWTAHAVIAQLEILEYEGRVELKRLGDECMVKLTPLGRRSLEVSEEEWNVSNKPSHNTNNVTIAGSTVGNVSQISGSPGATGTQTSTSNDLRPRSHRPSSGYCESQSND